MKVCWSKLLLLSNCCQAAATKQLQLSSWNLAAAKLYCYTWPLLRSWPVLLNLEWNNNQGSVIFGIKWNISGRVLDLFCFVAANCLLNRISCSLPHKSITVECQMLGLLVSSGLRCLYCFILVFHVHLGSQLAWWKFNYRVIMIVKNGRRKKLCESGA